MTGRLTAQLVGQLVLITLEAIDLAIDLFIVCPLAGHDAHWQATTTGKIRVCTRCGTVTSRLPSRF